jgi:GNAT superfamily N-acetyltransferase
MTLRLATINDIDKIQLLRNAVKENRLSDPSLVQDKDVADYITIRGKGWVYEIDDIIAGFAIVSLSDQNVWALFVHPDFEKRGIGRILHDEMMNWYFESTDKTVWLSTSPGTRAEAFYRKAGWLEKGVYGKDEIRFEMNKESWKAG